jgi:hypothetical protein
MSKKEEEPMRHMLTGGLLLAALAPCAYAQSAPEGAAVVKSYYAVINANGTVARSTTGVTSKRVQAGVYTVVFPANIKLCAYLATIGSATTAKQTPGGIKVSSAGLKAVGVQTGAGNTLEDRGFHLLVAC